MSWAWVALAGGAGAVCRYVVDHLITLASHRRLPYGTAVVNVSASILAGVVLGLVVHGRMAGQWSEIASLGFLGGYSTFSTYMLEALRLLEERRRGAALLYVLGSLAAGVAGAAGGYGIIRALLGGL